MEVGDDTFRLFFFRWIKNSVSILVSMETPVHHHRDVGHMTVLHQ